MSRYRWLRVIALAVIAVMLLSGVGITVAQDSDPTPVTETTADGQTVEVAPIDPDIDEPVVTAAETDEILPDDTGTVEDVPFDSLSDFDSYTSFQLWQLIAAPFIAWIVQLIKTAKMNAEQTKLALIGVSAVFAVVGAYLRGELTNVPYTVATAMQLVLLAWATYETILKSSLLAKPTAMLGAIRGGPSVESQRVGYQTGVTPPS